LLHDGVVSRMAGKVRVHVTERLPCCAPRYWRATFILDGYRPAAVLLLGVGWRGAVQTPNSCLRFMTTHVLTVEEIEAYVCKTLRRRNSGTSDAVSWSPGVRDSRNRALAPKERRSGEFDPNPPPPSRLHDHRRGVRLSIGDQEAPKMVPISRLDWWAVLGSKIEPMKRRPGYYCARTGRFCSRGSLGFFGASQKVLASMQTNP
jgi:hypothetical protein